MKMYVTLVGRHYYVVMKHDASDLDYIMWLIGCCDF